MLIWSVHHETDLTALANRHRVFKAQLASEDRPPETALEPKQQQVKNGWTLIRRNRVFRRCSRIQPAAVVGTTRVFTATAFSEHDVCGPPAPGMTPHPLDLRAIDCGQWPLFRAIRFPVMLVSVSLGGR